MNYVLRFSPDAEKELKKWKKSAPKLFKKLSEVLSELIIHPKQSIGHPEALKGGDGITYSRRISGKHRIVYDVYEQIVEVHVLSIGGHYDDK